MVRREKNLMDKSQYRCSLINIEQSQDDELDAILGELSELETQFTKEIVMEERKRGAITRRKEGNVNGTNGTNGNVNGSND